MNLIVLIKLLLTKISSVMASLQIFISEKYCYMYFQVLSNSNKVIHSNIDCWLLNLKVITELFRRWIFKRFIFKTSTEMAVWRHSYVKFHMVASQVVRVVRFFINKICFLISLTSGHSFATKRALWLTLSLLFGFTLKK